MSQAPRSKKNGIKISNTNLANLLDKDKIDKTALKLWSVRLSELYRAYEEHNDELAVLDPNDAQVVKSNLKIFKFLFSRGKNWRRDKSRRCIEYIE